MSYYDDQEDSSRRLNYKRHKTSTMKKPEIKKAKILQDYEGWEIIYNGKKYRYTHNDEDYGCKVLKKLLKDLGIEADIEEVC